MSRTTRWSPLAVVGRDARSSSAACAGAASPSPSLVCAERRLRRASPRSAPSPSEAPYTASRYPDDGDRLRARSRRLHRRVQPDQGRRRATVEFDLCAAGRRVPVEDRVRVERRSRTATGSTSTPPDKSYVTTTNGTGPYKLKAWDQGDHITIEANPNYWGTKALTPNARSSSGATTRPSACMELQAGAVDGIDNVGTDDFATVKGDSTLALSTADGAQHALPRVQRHRRAVGQREGPPGDRHGHRPQADRRQLLPARLGGRRLLHPVRDRRSAARATSGTTSTRPPPSRC